MFASVTARPDTVDNSLSFLVPGATPGSTIVFTINDGLGLGADSLHRDIEFVTPELEAWKPADFLDD